MRCRESSFLGFVIAATLAGCTLVAPVDDVKVSPGTVGAAGMGGSAGMGGDGGNGNGGRGGLDAGSGGQDSSAGGTDGGRADSAGPDTSVDVASDTPGMMMSDAPAGEGGDGATYACGDGVVNPGEECDNANDGGSGGCKNCKFTCLSTDPSRNCALSDPCLGTSTCDDAIHVCSATTPLREGAPCGTGKYCSRNVCTIESCGNGIITPGEECDDRNTVNDDGCNNDCKFSCVSTDMLRDCKLSDPCEGTSKCDDLSHMCSKPVPLADAVACSTPTVNGSCKGGICTNASCGNGVAEFAAGEECDHGSRNGAAGDGCDVGCKWVCVSTDPQRDCTPPNPCQSSTCNDQHVCSPPANVSDGKLCGGANKYCSNGTCTLSVCGNGKNEPGEFCDDGFLTDCGICNKDCTAKGTGPGTCGDGMVCPDVGETCDEGSGYHDSCGPCNATCNGAGDGRDHSACACAGVATPPETFQRCTLGICLPGKPCIPPHCSPIVAGCTGHVAFTNSSSLCAAPCRVVTANEWQAAYNKNPLHNYWTSDNLNYSGSGSAACSVSTTDTYSCGVGSSMAVCTDTQPDGANSCNWSQCGFGATTPNAHLGGCTSAAGAICICP